MALFSIVKIQQGGPDSVYQKQQTVEYRYQWMDSDKQHLRKRWDNAGHYPNLPNFPHHVHIGDEDTVEPGYPMGIVAFIDVLERTIGETA